MIGATMPIILYPGVQAMVKVPTAMSDNARMRPARLPFWSMYAPKMIAPSGRMR